MTKRKQKPIGFTKAEILLCIAEKGEADTIDLKWRLKDRLNFKSKKNLRTHLLDLVNDGLISKKIIEAKKTGAPQGIPDIYFAQNNFHTFSRLFNYFRDLDDFYMIASFMKSPYFRNYIISEEFQQKLTCHLIREIILELPNNVRSSDNLLKGDKNWDRAINILKNYKEVESGYATINNFQKALKKSNLAKSDGFQTAFDIGFTLLKNCDIDKFAYFLLNYDDKVADFVRKLSNIIILEKEKLDIFVMLKSSPSAVNSILNPRLDETDTNNPKMTGLKTINIVGIWCKFILDSINKDPNKMKKLNEIFINKNIEGSASDEVYALIKDFSNVSNNSPFYLIISSSFVYDFCNKRLAVPDDKIEKSILLGFLDYLFMPKIINKK